MGAVSKVVMCVGKCGMAEVLCQERTASADAQLKLLLFLLESPYVTSAHCCDRRSAGDTGQCISRARGKQRAVGRVTSLLPHSKAYH